MAQAVTPSTTVPISAGQIGKIQELFGAALRKSGLPSGPTQQVLETQGDSLAAALVFEVRKRVEAVSNLIVRRVKIDRSRTPQETLKATGRSLYKTDSVVDAMPRGEGEETDVYFFKLDLSERDGFISDDDLEKEYALRGLKSADPYSQTQVNIDDPAFADEHPNATHWKDKDGKWCYAAFDRWYDIRGVDVDRHDDGWVDDWWFAGLRK